jgi:ADP-ribose pyrophosphatase YjhB (NUDIX family)
MFYANPVPAAVAVIMRGQRILLARRAHPPHAGTWDLPGGFLEADETPEAGLRRELKEELGLRVRRARPIVLATDRYGPGGFPILTIIYRVTPEPGPLTPADDVSEARWFARDRIPYREIAFAAVRRELRAWLRGRRRSARP